MVECDEHWMAFINKNPNCISFVLHSSHYPLRVRSSYSILPLSLSLSHTPLCGFVSNLQFEYVEDVHPHSPNLLYTYIENTSLVNGLSAHYGPTEQRSTTSTVIHPVKTPKIIICLFISKCTWIDCAKSPKWTYQRGTWNGNGMKGLEKIKCYIKKAIINLCLLVVCVMI